MTPINFCYWLRGYFELNESTNGINPQQMMVVKRNLAIAFNYENDSIPEQNGDLEAIRNAKTSGIRIRKCQQPTGPEPEGNRY